MLLLNMYIILSNITIYLLTYQRLEVFETKRVHKRSAATELQKENVSLFQGFGDTPRRNCPHKSRTQLD